MNAGPSIALVSVLALLTAGATSAEHSIESYRFALETVQSAYAAHGGLRSVTSAGGVTVTLEGTFDLTARLQGRSPVRSEPTPIAETIAIDTSENRLGYDISWNNYQYSRQELREIHDETGRTMHVDRRAESAGWLPFAAVPDARERYKRLLPNFLLADALRNRSTLRHLGDLQYDGQAVHAVGYVTAAGNHLALYIAKRNRLLLGAATVFDMELLGDTEMRWTWSDYMTANGMMLPGRLQVHLAKELLKDVSVDIRPGVASMMFLPPPGIAAGDPPEEVASYDDFTLYSERPGSAREIAPGVYLVPNLRPGFHLFFVEFDKFLLAVDAPTGWYEIQQMPPYNFVRDESTSALAAKYIRIISETVPGKPVRYIALTHHHSDHIGGVRSFIAEGVTVLAALPAAKLAAQAARQPHTLMPDALHESAVEPNIEVVDGDYVISDDTMEVRLIELPAGNPKADGFLVVFLPNEKIMYLTSFIYPVAEKDFPIPESVPLALWFVRWLDASGLDVETIYNVHGRGRIEDWQLSRLRKMLQSGEYPVAGE